MSSFPLVQEQYTICEYTSGHMQKALINVLVVSYENQQCGFRTGPTQTVQYKHRRQLEAENFGFRK